MCNFLFIHLLQKKNCLRHLPSPVSHYAVSGRILLQHGGNLGKCQNLLYHCILQIRGPVSDIVRRFQEIGQRMARPGSPDSLLDCQKERPLRHIISELSVLAAPAAILHGKGGDRILDDGRQHTVRQIEPLLLPEMRCFGKKPQRLGIALKTVKVRHHLTLQHLRDAASAQLHVLQITLKPLPYRILSKMAEGRISNVMHQSRTQKRI